VIDFMQHMGALIGPKPLVEIVITQMENNQINFQIEGMEGKPIPHEHVLSLLSQVYHAVQVQAQQEAPVAHE